MLFVHCPVGSTWEPARRPTPRLGDDAISEGTIARMRRTNLHVIVALAGTIGALVAIASGAGVFLRGDLATQTVTTLRGVTVDVLTNGVYRFNGEAIASEGIGWDLVTLFLVVPALAISLPSLWRGSLRAGLIVAGILAYFTYQYFEYAVALAYGPLFLVYVAIGGLSISTLAVIVGSIDLGTLPGRFGPGYPRRGLIGFGIFMAVLLAGMWLPLVAKTVNLDAVADLGAGTTLVVQAFDLGILVPLGLFTALCVYRRTAIGFVLASVVAVKGVALGAGIAAMLVVEALATDILQPVPIVAFALISLVSAILAVRLFGSIAGEPAARPVPPVKIHQVLRPMRSAERAWSSESERR